MPDAKQFFLCIGAQKAGTTWLHQNLKSHRQVSLPRFKELHYFDTAHGLGVGRVQRRRERELLRLRARLEKEGEPSPRHKALLAWFTRFATSPVKDDDWYRSLFEVKPRHRAYGEITPAYAVLPPEGVAHVKAVAPDAKIVYIMRDPVERLISNRRMGLMKQIPEGETPSAEQWTRDFETRDPMEDHSRYDLIVPKWERVFGGRILFLFYETLHESETPLRDVCEHIGIDYAPEHFPKENARVAPTRKVAVPDEVVEKFARHYRPTIEWAAARFGAPVEPWQRSLERAL